jgi:hypothetical protein
MIKQTLMAATFGLLTALSAVQASAYTVGADSQLTKVSASEPSVIERCHGCGGGKGTGGGGGKGTGGGGGGKRWWWPF